MIRFNNTDGNIVRYDVMEVGDTFYWKGQPCICASTEDDEFIVSLVTGEAYSADADEMVVPAHFNLTEINELDFL